MSGTVYIYGLADPDEPEVIRYIGQSKCADIRLAGHLSEARSGHNGARAVWVRQLIATGKLPHMAILATTDEENAHLVERDYIASHLPTGALLNVRHTPSQHYLCKESGPTFPLDLTAAMPNDWGLYTVKEAASVLEVSASRLRQLVTVGKLEATRPARDLLISQEELERFAALERKPGRPRTRTPKSPEDHA